jgi:hypothetical protein
VTVFAQTADGRVFHEYRWGTGNCLIGKVFTQKYHDTRVEEVLAFLKECVEKHEEAKQPLKVGDKPAEGTTRIKPVQEWSGVVKHERLRHVLREKQLWLPPSGVLTSQRELQVLWQKWRADEKVPEVDFVRNLVVVVTSAVGARVQAIPEVDAKGGLKVFALAEVTADTGFGYQIAVLPRKGIKTVAGKWLDCGRAYCMCHLKFDPGYTETEALSRKLHSVCWGDLAQYECPKNDADLHKRTLDAAYKDAAKSKKALLYVADSDRTHFFLKACLAEPQVLKMLRKNFITMIVPFRNLNDCEAGVELRVYSPDRELLHTFDWGQGSRASGTFLESQHEANTKAVETFLEECLKKGADKREDK